jgi:endonuclease-3
MNVPSTPKRLFARVLRRLVARYGARPWRPAGKIVDELVLTILSQNTSAANYTAGYRNLRRRFRRWSAAANADLSEVERCIRISGLSNIKAPRIQAILRQVHRQHGTIDLEFLRDWPAERALDYLLAFDGVGPKTARCVLLFAAGRAVFPVDTHIHRIIGRLGVLVASVSAEQAHDVLTPLIPPKDRYAMHVLLVEHGRTTCAARSPKCEVCCLLDLCPVGQERMTR